MNTEIGTPCADFACEIMNNYDGNKYTQLRLSEEHNVPLDVIKQLTQLFGYNHRIRDSIKGLTFEEEVLFLAPYL